VPLEKEREKYVYFKRFHLYEVHEQAKLAHGDRNPSSN
jgi:hypothetical protein